MKLTKHHMQLIAHLCSTQTESLSNSRSYTSAKPEHARRCKELAATYKQLATLFENAVGCGVELPLPIIETEPARDISLCYWLEVTNG